MTTRLMLRGVQVWRNDRPLKPLAAPLDPARYMVDPEDREPPELKNGDIFHDAEDDLNYRVISRCRPEEGWAVATFWLGHYSTSFPTLIQMCQVGIMDGAMEHGSPTKRFRVRSEARAKKWLADLKKYRDAKPKSGKR